MTLFEDKQAALSGANTSEFLAEAMVESEKFRADYATLPNAASTATCGKNCSSSSKAPATTCTGT